MSKCDEDGHECTMTATRKPRSQYERIEIRCARCSYELTFPRVRIGEPLPITARDVRWIVYCGELPRLQVTL